MEILYQNSPYRLPVDAKLLTSPTHGLAWAADNRVSDCSNTFSCVRDVLGRPECDCLFLSFALRLFTVPWVLNFLTHPQITELTGNSRQLKWSLNRNCVSRKDFSRKYVSTANVFCSVVQGISKLTRDRLLDLLDLLDQSVFLMNLKQITELLEYCGNYSTFYELCFFCVTLSL